MQLSCTLDAKFHDKGKSCILRVFLPRSHACQIDVKCETGATVEFELPLGREAFEEDVPLCLWWYIHRSLRGDDNVDSDTFQTTSSHVDFGTETKSVAGKRQQQEQPYTARFGVAHVSLKELTDKQRLTATAVDAKCAETATLQLTVLRVREAGLEFKQVDDRRHDEACNKWFARQTDEYANALAAVHTEIKTTNIGELPRHEFAAIVQEIGAVPIWAWVYGNTIWEEKRRTEKGPAEQKRLARLEQLADMLTGRGDAKERDLEVLNEMVTLQTRATLYVLDTSMGRHRHDNSVDDWTNIRHNPSIFEAGADCEDCALEMTRESTAIRASGSRLGKLLESRYMTCFAIVTLSLGSGYTYHAVCIQVPRDWLLGIASSATDVPILHEGTSYTTGAWQFSSKDCTTEQYDVSHVEFPVESICKVPAETVRSNKDSPYGHVHSLFCPEMLESKGVAQLEVLHNGALGAPVKQFMQASAAVTFKRVAAPTNWKALVRYLMYWMPVPGSFDGPSDAGDDPVPPRGLFLNCVFREVDYTPAVERRMRERAEGRKVTVRRIVLPGSGSRLVQCTSPV